MGFITDQVDFGGEILDVTRDEELKDQARYIVGAFNTMGVLGKTKPLPKGSRFDVVRTRFSQYRELPDGSKLCSGHSAEVEDNKYAIIIDERLEPHEALAVLAHEIGHVAGGYAQPEKTAQTNALKVLKAMHGNYDHIGSQETKEILEREAGLRFDAKAREREEIGQALAYLASTAKTFGISERELAQNDIHMQRRNRGGLERNFGIILLTASITMLTLGIKAQNITGNTIGNKLTTLNIIPLILLGIGILLTKKRRNKTINIPKEGYKKINIKIN